MSESQQLVLNQLCKERDDALLAGKFTLAGIVADRISAYKRVIEDALPQYFPAAPGKYEGTARRDLFTGDWNIQWDGVIATAHDEVMVYHPETGVIASVEADPNLAMMQRDEQAIAKQAKAEPKEQLVDLALELDVPEGQSLVDAAKEFLAKQDPQPTFEEQMQEYLRKKGLVLATDPTAKPQPTTPRGLTIEAPLTWRMGWSGAR